ncbi:MAG: N-formylglutamate amidohydrolase [Alphaproteobacteria bacterium]|nr:N-formylglutamate amidohydrolase [Alphaproteobacteria bacterium]
MSSACSSTVIPNPLLGPNDPPPVEIFNGDGAAPVLFICDHASAALPESLGLLGLQAADLTRHIAIDIGAAALTRRLAQHFDGRAVLAGYSRLVIDCNRITDDHTSIREISEHTVIPGNRNLSPADRERRIEALFRPYHAAVVGCIADYAARGITPAIVAVHSFTPVYRGLDRPWHVGILSNRDRRLADPLVAALSTDESLVVGDNQPYSGLAFAGYTIEIHAIAAGLPNVMIEIRQDLVATDAEVARWAGILQNALAPILEDPALFTVLDA